MYRIAIPPLWYQTRRYEGACQYRRAGTNIVAMNETALREHLEQARLRRLLPEPEMRRYLRQRLGLSQQQLAEALEVDRVTITRYESGTRDPSARILRDYLEVLGVLGEEVVAS